MFLSLQGHNQKWTQFKKGHKIRQNFIYRLAVKLSDHLKEFHP